MVNAETVTYFEMDAKKKFNLVQTFSVTFLSLGDLHFCQIDSSFATICRSSLFFNVFLKLIER